MKRVCADNWENIVDLAEGRSNVDGQEHVNSCATCAAALRDLRKVLGAAAPGFVSAPSDLIDRAVALMPQVVRVRAGFLRTTLGIVGARAEADDFQIVLDLKGEASRLMYIRDQTGWEVIGKVPSADWRVERNGNEVPLDGERYSFTAKNLEDTSFDLVCGTDVIEIPSAEELLLSGH